MPENNQLVEVILISMYFHFIGSKNIIEDVKKVLTNSGHGDNSKV